MVDARVKRLQVLVVVIFVIIGLRLFYIQVIDSKYKVNATNNVLRYEVLYPARGEVFDRNGEFLVQSKESYDLMVIPREVKAFDTVMMGHILGVSPDRVKDELRKASQFSSRRPTVVFKQLPKDVKMKIEERAFPGFYTVYRTIRSYPRKIAGNLLGYVGEVNEKHIERDLYYRSGDYVGMSGIEQAYESVLRGVKGVRINMVDVHGVSKGSYMDGIYDTVSVAGSAIYCSIDAKLQALAEELMKGKVGSIVAIEPSTGEILVMASSPTYDPDELAGRDRGNNYMKLLENKRHPLFNRAVMASYPPGSTFKLVNGLIGLQEGVLTSENVYPCSGSYTVGRGVKCHQHSSPLNLTNATANSCNAFFCYVFRNIVDNKKYGSVKNGLDVWGDYVRSFGFGRKLDSDFLDELKGNVPNSDFYDKKYKGRWNSLTAISLSIGQGEMGCTPLQMANLAAIVANRGFYYIPHVVKKIEGRDSVDARFYQKQFTKVDSKYFDPIVEGMYRAVNVQGTATGAAVPGLDICGKTGTAQNTPWADHSTFLCFAPRNNPKIAVSVYVEHGRFGATVAVPIASLIVEQYLTDTISRPDMVQRVKGMQISYPRYDNAK